MCMDKDLKKYVGQRVARLRERCYNKRLIYNKCYWNKGIKVRFTARQLLNWLEKHNINPVGLVIHRIDNDGNYALDNIEFLTPAEHGKRHRTVKYCKACNVLLESYNRRRGYCSDKCARKSKKLNKKGFCARFYLTCRAK